MRQTGRALRKARIGGTVSAVALLALACGEAPEEKLEQAEEDFRGARQEMVEAGEALAEKKRAVEEAEEALQRARRELREARKQLESSAKRLDRRATDVAIFRSIQPRLLDADALDGATVVATVDDQVVTLSGEVPDSEARERALEIARSTAGVENVRDRMLVEGSQQGERESQSQTQTQTQTQKGQTQSQ